MKYVIDTDDLNFVFEGAIYYGFDTNARITFSSKRIETLEPLTAEYVNEHFGDLRDEAYKRGMEDATRAGKLVCESCAIHGTRNCDYCCHNWESKYKSKQTDDILIDIIRNGIHNWVTELNVKLDDIASILEGMRND